MIANEHADLSKAKESVYILQRGLLIEDIPEVFLLFVLFGSW